MIGESLDRLGRVKSYTQLDPTDTYHGKKTREDNKLKTAFRTRNGRLEYQTMELPIHLSRLRQ